jgi:hypothetical protein
MTEPGPVGDAAATAQAIVENAQRLGLTWTLRLATVVDGSNAGAIVATYDGDTIPIAMTSMIGTLSVGQRVYVIQVPPSGNFITGFATENQIGRVFVKRVVLSASATSITIDGIPPDILSLDVDWTLRSDEGPATFSGGFFILNNIIAAGYITRYWTLANASGSAGVHTQTFGSTNTTIGAYATGTATAGRFAGGRISFPAWNSPHAGSVNWLFRSGVETAANVGNFTTGEGTLTVAGPYTSITLLPGSGGSFVAGSQVCAHGFFAS